MSNNSSPNSDFYRLNTGSKYKIKIKKGDLPELDDKCPLSLGNHHNKRNNHRITPEYSIKNLHKTTTNQQSTPHTHSHLYINILSYIGSVCEGSNGRDKVDGNTKNGGKCSHDAETPTND